MTALNDRFWAKVLFSQFIKHYRKMNDEQIVADIKQSMDDLEDLIDEGDSFGAKMVRWSMERVDQYPQARENGKKGGRPRKQDTTADAPAREDGEFKSDSGDAGNLESATSANHYGVAAISDDAEACTCLERGRSTPATVSNISQDASTRKGEDESLVHPAPNMRRVPQNEAPAHGFSGGRTAQGTMSRSPEAAAQSGKDSTLDSRTDKDGQPNEARQSRRTGADSLRSDCHSAPVRLPSFDEFTAFIDAQGLDYTDAREWWEMTMVDREGNDRDGNPIGNWKGALKRFCKNRAAKRSKGEVK